MDKVYLKGLKELAEKATAINGSLVVSGSVVLELIRRVEDAEKIIAAKEHEDNPAAGY